MRAPETGESDPPRGAPRPRNLLLRRGSAQFAGQFLGLALALLVSHLIARRLGVGPEADAFLLGRRLITAVSETLSQVLVVVFIPMIAAHAAAGAGLGRIVLRSVGPGLLGGFGLAVAFVLGAPAIVAAVAPDFPVSTQALAAQVIAFLALSLPAVVATAALAAHCNVNGTFGGPAAIRQLPRAGVAAALVLAATGAVATTAASAYALVAWIAALLTFAVAARAHRAAVDAVPASKIDPRRGRSTTTRRGTAAVIIAIGALGFLWIETAVAAAQGPGSVAMLDFGQRLGALLGNTLATALGLVVFADLSRRAAKGEIDALGPSFQRATVTGLALIFPITVGMISNADALVELLLGYGAFARADGRQEVVRLIQLMSVAPVGALVLRLMLARILAQDDLPVMRLVGGATLVDLAARLGLFALLIPRFGLMGVPITLILAPVVPTVALALWLRRRGTFTGSAEARHLAPVLAASTSTALAIAAGAVLAGPLIPAMGDKAHAALQLALSGGLGVATLGTAAILLRIRPRHT